MPVTRSRRSVRRSARRSARRSVRKVARRSVRRSARKIARRSTRKVAARRSVRKAVGGGYSFDLAAPVVGGRPVVAPYNDYFLPLGPT